MSTNIIYKQKLRNKTNHINTITFIYFAIIKPLFLAFFNYCVLVLSAIYKINACKKLENHQFAQTNVAKMPFVLTRESWYLRKLIPLS